MRTLVLPLMGLLLASSSWAEEEKEKEEGAAIEGRLRIGVVLMETTPEVKIADDFAEVMISYLAKESGGGAEIVGPEELRGAIAPAGKRGQQNADIQKCLATPACLTRTIVQMDLGLFGAGYIGQTGKREYRIQLVFYDVYGHEIARDDFKLRGKESDMLAAGFPSVAKVLQSGTVAFEFKPEPGAVVFLNDRQVKAERVALLKPDTYQVRVERPECRPWTQTFQTKAGETHKASPTTCDAWVPAKAAELLGQCLHYTRLVPPNWQAARPKCEEALAAGGKEDPKLLLTLARIAHEELELEKSFDYAERAAQVTRRPSAEEDIKAAERFTADVLRKRYGPVIIRLSEDAKIASGYIYVRDKGGLINPDKKRVFTELQKRFATERVTLTRDGTMYYLPFGVYKANEVPFTVEQGKAPEVEIIPATEPPRPVSEMKVEKPGVPLSVWATGGAGVAALVTGVLFHVAAFGKVDEYMAATTRPAADKASRDGERFQTFAGGFYGVAAVAAGGAFLLYTWRSDSTEEAVRVTPTPGGVTATIQF
ncbi:MAG: hypothetical protein HY437_00465 [Candidatus Magasanikbacteria bacterium]|nr:hypothetical protein [Candidatus Magasanikbacteria bacterium]